ncbi:Agenet-like domain [Macleaya cordata]|uniref:Agenet-like domain n=1 Tax=Macleaya cordata TaxID=56857 RepID=A0A200R228_MACCD|nr:Agenet-like domain [Macleaya cordata]
MADSHYFSKGAEVEVSSEDEGFRGAWFVGTVIRTVNKNKKILIEYHNLVENEKTKKPLREFIDVVNVRPRPPQESSNQGFNVSDLVDAFHNDGWWEGVVTKVLKKNARYSVYFRDSKEQIEYSQSELRCHREWVDGSWDPPLEDHPQSTPSKSELDQNKESSWMRKGTLVEVSSDEEGFVGSWFAATIIKKIAENKFIIEYQNLKTDDETELLREEAEAKHIRPCPPNTPQVDRYSLLQEVDAHYSDGWWCGVISKVLSGTRYIVYFRESKEEMEFDHSQLRPHQDWVNGKWVRASLV